MLDYLQGLHFEFQFVYTPTYQPQKYKFFKTFTVLLRGMVFHSNKLRLIIERKREHGNYSFVFPFNSFENQIEEDKFRSIPTSVSE